MVFVNRFSDPIGYWPSNCRSMLVMNRKTSILEGKKNRGNKKESIDFLNYPNSRQKRSCQYSCPEMDNCQIFNMCIVIFTGEESYIIEW